MKRLIAVAVFTAGCGPMFDSPMAPEPVAWNVTGSNALMCLERNPPSPVLKSPKLSAPVHPASPCPPGWSVPRE
jgi:hypothetical protein